MTLREATYYTAVCDLCGTANDEGDYTAWSTQDGADMDADSAEWHCERGNHICYHCLPVSDFEDLADVGELDPGHGAEGHNCYAAPPTPTREEPNG